MGNDGVSLHIKIVFQIRERLAQTNVPPAVPCKTSQSIDLTHGGHKKGHLNRVRLDASDIALTLEGLTFLLTVQPIRTQ